MPDGAELLSCRNSKWISKRYSFQSIWWYGVDQRHITALYLTRDCCTRTENTHTHAQAFIYISRVHLKAWVTLCCAARVTHTENSCSTSTTTRCDVSFLCVSAISGVRHTGVQPCINQALHTARLLWSTQSYQCIYPAKVKQVAFIKLALRISDAKKLLKIKRLSIAFFFLFSEQPVNRIMS